MEEVRIDKLVHGGQGLGTLPDGRKVFVWNALPGELVKVRLAKKRRGYAEGMTEEVLKPSPERVKPIDDAYLSTSPWQILDFDAENKYKKEILAETFAREKVRLPKFDFVTDGTQLGYRNKMEYSFFGDEQGLHLALYSRGTHRKQTVSGSSLAMPSIDKTANHILEILNKNGIRGSQLKTIIIRANKPGDTVAALFVKDENFPKLDFGGVCRGISVYYSNPKSPASVITRELYREGDTTLTDKILGTDITYDVKSFFQVNLPVFELALKRIDYFTGGYENKIDFYSGVGAIGLPIGGTKTLVESDEHNVEMAKRNVSWRGIEVLRAPSEKALEYIRADSCIIVDPPRAGLHRDLTARLLEVRPRQIVYLSCNPSTQARDVASLQSAYKIRAFEGYNFFPRTPHIESLVILEII